MEAIKQLKTDKKQSDLNCRQRRSTGDPREERLYRESQAVIRRHQYIHNHPDRPYHKTEEQIDHQNLRRSSLILDWMTAHTEECIQLEQ